MLKREAEAVWRGDGMTGKGELTTPSGVLKGTQYSYSTRFENGVGTNPEELIGAAHAGCFSMALAFQLNGAGFKPEELRTSAVVTMEKEGAGWSIRAIALRLRAKVPGISNEKFQELAQAAKSGCPVSKALASVPISLEAALG
jgi:osmotically inducible protein OsmC